MLETSESVGMRHAAIHAVSGVVLTKITLENEYTVGVVKGTALSRTGFAALAGPKRPIVMSMCWPQRESHKLKVPVLLAIPHLER